jgi:hypothetical protein
MPASVQLFDGSATQAWEIGFSAGGSGNRSWFGGWSEAIALGTDATTDIRQKLEGYLAWKWGTQTSLAIGHPYKSAAPTP